MTNIQKHEKWFDFKNNPFVWAAWSKFILWHRYFAKWYSPSTDKNTFLLCLFDEKNVKDTIEFYEFKVIQNNNEQTKMLHNSWVVIESEKTLNLDENNSVSDLIKKPSVHK